MYMAIASCERVRTIDRVIGKCYKFLTYVHSAFPPKESEDTFAVSGSFTTMRLSRR
jgi:hypothetical protein